MPENDPAKTTPPESPAAETKPDALTKPEAPSLTPAAEPQSGWIPPKDCKGVPQKVRAFVTEKFGKDAAILSVSSTRVVVHTAAGPLKADLPS